MPAVRTRTETSFQYTVRVGDPCNPVWWFTIVANQDGSTGVRDIRTPRGRLSDTHTQIPDPVLDEINAARADVENILAQSSAVNGTLNFTEQTTQSIVFSTPFANTAYRVHVTVQDFVAYRITNKTQIGFDLELNVTYTGTVQYDVFV